MNVLESLNLQSLNILAQFNLVHVSVTEAWVLLVIAWPVLWTVCAAVPYGLSCPLFLDLVFCLWHLTDRVLVLCLSLWAAAQHFVAVCCYLESLRHCSSEISMSSGDWERNRKVTLSSQHEWWYIAATGGKASREMSTLFSCCPKNLCKLVMP